MEGALAAETAVLLLGEGSGERWARREGELRGRCVLYAVAALCVDLTVVAALCVDLTVRLTQRCC